MNLQQLIEKHKILIPVIFWGFWVALIVSLMLFRDTKPDLNDIHNVDYVDSTCLMNKVTLASLRELASNESIGVTQKDVDWVNQKPLCRDLCIQQRKYATENSDEWYANEDVRTICKNVGLPLPE